MKSKYTKSKSQYQKATPAEIFHVLKKDWGLPGNSVNSGRCRCPGHNGDDKHLSVKIDGDKVLFNCFSHGCSYEAIMRGAGLWRDPVPVKAKPKKKAKLNTAVPIGDKAFTDPEHAKRMAEQLKRAVGIPIEEIEKTSDEVRRKHQKKGVVQSDNPSPLELEYEEEIEKQASSVTFNKSQYVDPTITELDVLMQFLSVIKDNYCTIDGDWRRWAGTHWSRDGARTEITKIAITVAKFLGAKSPKTWGWNSRDAGAYDDQVVSTASAWDKPESDCLFNARNGTVNLNTLELQQHNRADKLLAVADVHYTDKPNIDALEFWYNFLFATIPDEGDRDFIRQFFGYSLTGWIMDHHAPFLIGAPGSGKSTLITAIQNVLGSWSVDLNAQHLFTNDNSHQTGLMQYHGKRLAVCRELPKGRLNTSLFNMLTGDSEITGRHMRQDFVTYRRTSKLLCIGNPNHMPSFGTGHADGIKRRLIIIDCPNIPDKPDPLLPRQLATPESKSAILHWMILGLQEFIDNGYCLEVSESTRERTNQEFVDQDSVGLFLLDRCRTDAKGVESSAGGVHSAYVEYCENEGFIPLNRNRFSKEMKSRGFLAKTTKDKNQKTIRVYESIYVI